MLLIVQASLSLLITLNCLSKATIDINPKQLQMVSDSLTFDECRRLLETLHTDDYKFDHTPTGDAEPTEISCHRLLKYWNQHEGKDKTYHLLALRLQQLGRSDISSKLSKSVNLEMSNQLRADLHLPEITELPNIEYEPLQAGEIFHPPMEEKDLALSNVQITIIIICSCILLVLLSIGCSILMKECFPDVYQGMRYALYDTFTGYPPPREKHYLCC